MLRAGEWSEPLFLIGADQFADFLTWNDPEGVLALARIGVATRLGYPRERLDAVLKQLSRPDRVRCLRSSRFRSRCARSVTASAAGEWIEGLVPPAVTELIGSLGLYRGNYRTAATLCP